MANLSIDSESPYDRNGNTITVSGKCSAGATVRVIIMLRSGTSIDNQSEFNAAYNNTPTRAQATVATATPGGSGGRTTWSAAVPVSGLTAGTEYSIYASDGAGKLEPQHPVTFR